MEVNGLLVFTCFLPVIFLVFFMALEAIVNRLEVFLIEWRRFKKWEAWNYDNDGWLDDDFDN